MFCQTVSRFKIQYNVITYLSIFLKIKIVFVKKKMVINYNLFITVQ